METRPVYEVILSKSAYKYISKQPNSLREKFESALLEISESPLSGPNIIAMKGPWKGYYRYEFFHYRITYTVNHNQLLVEVEEAGPRGDVYKKRR